MFSKSASTQVYEFRYYQIAAQNVGQFKQLASRHVPHRAQRSRLVGFWLTELGALNHVLHVWEYDSLTHRKTVREEMYADSDWNEFLSQANPMFQRMDNWLCRCLRGDLSANWSDKEFYKLSTVRYAPSEAIEYAKRIFKDSVGICVKRPGFKAAFETTVGHAKEFFVVESSTNPDDLLNNPDPFSGSANTMVDTKILVPLPWNEWLRQP